jgi:putative aminopeptidase FrvX
MTLTETILELSAMAGPAGFEKPVADRVKELLSEYMDDVHTDVMGNVIGVRRCGRENAKKLLFDAHIDEIGFIITSIEDGFLRFASLGSVDARMLPASEIRILSDPPVIGIIGAIPPHLQKDGESDKALKTEDMTIDIGLKQEEAAAAIPLGTAAVYNTGAQILGNDLICGKALDDRACFASVLRALELLRNVKLEVDLYVMASVQEEVGTRGAKTGAFAIAPDWCVSVDVGHAVTPDCKNYETKECGGGVVISRGPNMNRALTELAVELANETGIKYQIGIEASGDSGTNARVIQISREGVATALLGIPLKYMHSPVETINITDAEETARLLCEIAKALKGDEVHA